MAGVPVQGVMLSSRPSQHVEQSSSGVRVVPVAKKTDGVIRVTVTLGDQSFHNGQIFSRIPLTQLCQELFCQVECFVVSGAQPRCPVVNFGLDGIISSYQIAIRDPCKQCPTFLSRPKWIKGAEHEDLGQFLLRSGRMSFPGDRICQRCQTTPFQMVKPFVKTMRHFLQHAH